MIQLIHQEEVVSTSHWKEITKAYKYKMKPTKKQEEWIYTRKGKAINSPKENK